jgi:hypothetical protein
MDVGFDYSLGSGPVGPAGGLGEPLEPQGFSSLVQIPFVILQGLFTFHDSGPGLFAQGPDLFDSNGQGSPPILGKLCA